MPEVTKRPKTIHDDFADLVQGNDEAAMLAHDMKLLKGNSLPFIKVYSDRAQNEPISQSNALFSAVRGQMAFVDVNIGVESQPKSESARPPAPGPAPMSPEPTRSKTGPMQLQALVGASNMETTAYRTQNHVMISDVRHLPGKPGSRHAMPLPQASPKSGNDIRKRAAAGASIPIMPADYIAEYVVWYLG